jgi:hypothetical protein
MRNFQSSLKLPSHPPPSPVFKTESGVARRTIWLPPKVLFEPHYWGHRFVGSCKRNCTRQLLRCSLWWGPSLLNCVDFSPNQSDHSDDRRPVRRNEINTTTESEKNASTRDVPQPKTKREAPAHGEGERRSS